MNVSEPFIRRPVMTTLLMLGLFVFGVIGFKQLPINDMPKVDYPVIVVSASLPGASPETMASAVATPLERQFATIAGIDSMTSNSVLGSSSIVVVFSLDRNIDGAAQDVQTAISAALPLLPSLPTRPFFRKVNPADAPIVYLALSSQTLPLSAVDEYAETLVAQRISMVDGVAQVNVYGSQKYAVRARLDPDRLAAMGLGIDQVHTAMTSGNVKVPTGTLFGPYQAFNVQANDQLPNAAAFRKLIVAVRNGRPVYLGDLGTVVDGVENTLVANWTRAGRDIVLAIQRQPNTNTVQVVDDIRKVLPSLQAQIPASVHLGILFDRAAGIRQSVVDVERSLILAMILVVLVIFFFLRNLTATFIPSVALPMSIIGTFAVMALLGFSLNHLSLMGLTLCVGYVVDDAIVMLENIVRHIEMGEPTYEAALQGSREVGFTIVSMTLSLVAVFIPILFMGGLIGRLFNEFAVTITAAILISGFVSLSLTPMLCSRILQPSHRQRHGRWSRLVEAGFHLMLDTYDVMLRFVLRFRACTLIASCVLLAATVALFMVCPKGFIPTADTGQIMGTTEGPQDASFDYMVRHTRQVMKILSQDPDIADYNASCGGGGFASTMNNGRAFITLKPLDQRKATADQIIQRLRRKLARIVGLRIYLTNPPSLHIGGQVSKSVYQVTLQSLSTSSLYRGVDILQNAMRGLPGIQDVNSDLQVNSPKIHLEVDRDAASALGLTSRQVDTALSDAYGTRQISTIYTSTNEYQVILELQPKFQQGPALLPRLYLQSGTGHLVPLSAVTRYSQQINPLAVRHRGQLPAATVSYNLAPGYSLGSAVTAIDALARRVLPAGVTASMQGGAQAFQQSLQSMMVLLLVALAVIYIVLGILYESFWHPITILAGLPSAGLGALLTLIIFHKELDIYGFLGLVMLIGIVKKNAIMMIDHALQVEREDHKPPAEAIYEASLVRFRPIMMTTMAALMGSVPIALGLGAGGEARQSLGLAVVGGLMVSQVLTLLITPVVYVYIDGLASRFRGRPRRRPAEQLAAQP